MPSQRRREGTGTPRKTTDRRGQSPKLFTRSAVSGSRKRRTVASVSSANAPSISKPPARLSTRLRSHTAPSRQGGDARGRLVRRLEHRIVRHHAPGEAHLVRFRGAEGFAEQQQFAGLRQPHDARQDRRHAAGREHAPLDLGEETFGAFAEDGEIAVDRPFQPAAHGPAMNGADHHLVAQNQAARNLLDRLDEGPSLRLAGGLVLDVLEVVAGAEGTPCAAQDQRAHPIVGKHVVQCCTEIGEQCGVERVEPLRPVERECGDARRHAGEDGTRHLQFSLISRCVLPPVRGSEPGGSRVTLAEARSAALIASSTRAASASVPSASGASSASTGRRS